MKKNGLKYVIFLAILSVAGILLVQFVFLKRTREITQLELQESTTIALREVVWQILQESGQISKFDTIDPVERVSDNYYLANVNDLIDPEMLEKQLIEQFRRHSVGLDFEYAISDPEKKELVSAGYICAHGDSCRVTVSGFFPAASKYPYCFGIYFPTLSPYLNYKLQGWYFIAGLLLIVLSFFGYSLWVIIRQRQLTDIQKLFINNLTHELKTPISSINLSAQVISEEKILENPSRLFEYAKIIREQSNRLAGSVDKVLNLASLEKNKIHLATEKIGLLGFVEKSLLRFRQSEAGINAELILLKRSEEFEVWADKFHFGNVLQNILENGVKYCKNSPVIEISAEKKRNFVVLNVKDNGIGIPREDRRKIFKKFYRVPTGNIHDVKGFGLGLDYVRRIVAAHRWKIYAEGNSDGGSTFKIVIPIAHE